MGFAVQNEGRILQLAFWGHVQEDEVVAALAACHDANAANTSIAAIVDTSALEDTTMEVENLHRIVTDLRRLPQNPPEFRWAVYDPNGIATRIVRDYIDVRDLLSTPRPLQPPQLRVFDTLTDAEAWVGEIA